MSHHKKTEWIKRKVGPTDGNSATTSSIELNYQFSPLVSYPQPSYPSPHSFLALSVIIALMCCFIFVNPTSALFGVPAVTVAATSVAKAQFGKWKVAHKLGNVALSLSIANIIYTLTIAILFLGFVLGSNRTYIGVCGVDYIDYPLYWSGDMDDPYGYGSGDVYGSGDTLT